jgi:hypothetical protein
MKSINLIQNSTNQQGAKVAVIFLTSGFKVICLFVLLQQNQKIILHQHKKQLYTKSEVDKITATFALVDLLIFE